MTVTEQQAVVEQEPGPAVEVVAGDGPSRRRRLAVVAVKGMVAAVVVIGALEEADYLRRQLRRASDGWWATVAHRQRSRLNREELLFLVERLVARGT